MILSERPGGRRSRGGWWTLGRIVLAVLLLVLAFLVGVAFARTLDERPKPRGVITSVRTLTPLPQQAVPRTVTVTVTTP